MYVGEFRNKLPRLALTLPGSDGDVDVTFVPTPVYLAEIEWLNETRSAEILALDGNPLLGTGLLVGCHLDIEAVEGGEIIRRC